MSTTERIFALLSSNGVACPKTVLTERNFNTRERERIERKIKRDNSFNKPIPKTWTDVSHNHTCREAAQ